MPQRMMRVPKDLKQAIDTCYERARYMGSDNPRSYTELQDYLAQKFTKATLRSESQGETDRLFQLWADILNNEKEQ